MSMAHTLFQLARFNCTSCLYFFFGATPGGRTGTGDPNGRRGPMPGNAGGGGAPPGGGGGGGGPPPGGGGGGGGPPPGNGGGGGGGGPPPGNGGGGGGGGPPPGGGGGGGGGGAAPPGGGGGGGGPPEKQKHNELQFLALSQMTIVAMFQDTLFTNKMVRQKSDSVHNVKHLNDVERLLHIFSLHCKRVSRGLLSYNVCKLGSKLIFKRLLFNMHT